MRLHILSIIALALAINTAQAGTFAPSIVPTSSPSLDNDDRWEFNLVPYVWIAGIDGSAANSSVTANLDIGFDDTLSNLEGGLIFAAEARKGRFGARLDFLYLQVGGKAQTAGRLFGSADVDIEITIAEPTIAWRFHEDDNTAFDVYAGARILHSDTELKLSRGIRPARSFGDDKTKISPIIGLSLRQYLTDDVFMFVKADIGGFGIDSDFMTNAFGGVGYEFNKTVTGYLGYRYLNLDITGDTINLDVALQGPAIGLGFRF